ncbi:TetR-like C-terminal domain-containing protein [Williamsia muralis]|uniref:TetR-like C-terminal domain-containing protein n=1 Tax=Williamsia marianensis TaxID=85044 RepID=UPI000DE6DF10|nr:TetR-like C-terminal domain-containing protein [Williamsia marianensis]PVY33829.1 WHG domain-containing protein [Williamsia marianensis]
MARAYVDFAARRPGMFELLFRHDLLEGGGENLRDTTIPMLTTVEGLVGAVVGRDQAGRRALLLWTSIHGIATLTATRALNVFETDLEALVTDAVYVHLHTAAEQ